jgi:hypothetical protein
MPAVTLAALFVGLALIAGGRGESRGTMSLRPRIAGLVGALGLGAFVVSTLIGNSALSASSQAADAANYPKAVREAKDARTFLPGRQSRGGGWARRRHAPTTSRPHASASVGRSPRSRRIGRSGSISRRCRGARREAPRSFRRSGSTRSAPRSQTGARETGS